MNYMCRVSYASGSSAFGAMYARAIARPFGRLDFVFALLLYHCASVGATLVHEFLIFYHFPLLFFALYMYVIVD